ncbi:MAG TPA: alpha/beta fold hydrolase, partial [Ardenticatenaceae bacterium]|nr:alpha/beta fold hydrolase [Ardenticatenaceae bacterium]
MTDLPVVFVPGLGGSFNLGVLLDLSGPTINGWSFPPFVDYGQQFLRTLTSAGYVRDRTLFVAFYDWRKPVDDSARLYLVPWLDRALKRSGRDKVILVAHSMGGLVARAYVQSRDYRGDVAQVITLGTPHRGTPVGYFPWEGGDLRWDGIARVALEVYLWYLGHLHPFQTALDPLAVIRTQARGLRDVLPIYDYLFSQGPPLKVKPEDQMVEQNGWGELVNAPLALDTLFGRTKMSTINGTGFTTLESIVVQAPPQPPGTPPRYPDGRPVAEQSDALGDGTVPLASAAMTDSRCHNLPPLTIPHGSLPDLAAAQVLAELNVAAPATPAPRAATPRLVFLTASPVEITVELPPEEPVVAQAAAAPGTRRRRRRPTRPRTHQHGHPAKRYTMV